MRRRVKPPSREPIPRLPDGKPLPEYNCWVKMWGRCSNPRAHNYKWYGGRGITVCERWQSFKTFLDDMGNRPSPTHSIDRIDFNGNYEPSNCRWATKLEQGRNSRKVHFLTIGDVTRSISEWSELTGIDGPTIRYRLKHGLSAAQALGEPVVPGQKGLCPSTRFTQRNDISEFLLKE